MGRSIALIALCLGSPLRPAAADGQALERLDARNLRLYYTGNSPVAIEHRGSPVIEGIYFYTAVKTEGGFIEGFNYRRNEDGLLHFDRAAVEGGHRLTWTNRRFVYDPPTHRTDKLAGEATVALTLTPTGVSLRYRGRIEPNAGFGEIGFFVPEAALTGGAEGSWVATLPDGGTEEGALAPSGKAAGGILDGLTRLLVTNPRGALEFSFEGQVFPGSHGLHWQDFRDSDTHPGCFRFVTNFDTAQGNEFDYAWHVRIVSAAPRGDRDEAIPAPDPASLPKTPELPGGPVFGEPTAVAPAAVPTGPGTLEAIVDEAGAVSLRDGEQTVIDGDYFALFPAGEPARQESTDNGESRIALSYDAPKGELSKQVICTPDEAWVLWTVRAKEPVQGEVGFHCPEGAFRPPFISYRWGNQSMVEESGAPELSSTYCLISGGGRDPREFQCGTSSRPDWVFQDLRAQSGTYRYVATLRLEPGQEWRAVFRYVRRSAEGYPRVSFDGAREERGILSTLLPDAIADGFTIVPARSGRYTVGGRPVEVALKYYATDARHRTVHLRCSLLDMWGRKVGERAYALANEGRRFCALSFPVALPLNGAYRMEIAYGEGEGARTRELVLVALPEVPDTGYRPDSVFGAAIGGGDYLGTLGRRIGLKWNRCHCAIGDSQAGAVLPERGRYTWDAMEQAYEFHRKYDLLACHSISEGWRAPWLSEMWRERPFEEYLQAYVEEYVRPLAVRFRGRITCWEVTNEPYYQFKDSPDKWVRLMEATYRALKEVDPTCTVVGTCGPPGSMGYSWYRRTFELGALDYQDAVSAHLYHFGPWVGAGVAVTVRKWMQEIRRIMAEHGRVLPLWNSETTVTPPASMYRDPSHTRYVRYHPGEGPTDPVEQAQTYFKVLAVHKAEDVKYSFHIFHGGIEYTSHTGEYDETPLAFLAAQAALAKTLEEATYIGDVALHEDIQACLFARGDGLVLVPWGPMFLKHDCAQVTLPLAAPRFTARDVFDNPLPVAGDDRETRLAVTWEAFFLLADQMTAEELRAACGKARVSVHYAESAEAPVSGTFHGENAGRASRADWVGFHAADLTSAANRSFRDDEPEDGEGGWTDEGENDLRMLPPGEWLVNGVPFRIIDPEGHAGGCCIVLKGGPQPEAPFPERATIPVGQRLSKLHFLHTVTWGSRDEVAFTYVLHYADGFTERVPVTVGRNVEDWWALAEPPEAKVAWEGPNLVREKVRVFHAEYETSHPAGAQATLDRVEIVTAGLRSIPVVIAITGVYSN